MIPICECLSFQKLCLKAWCFHTTSVLCLSTKGDDGDPVDVLVLMDEPTFPGCLLECRLVRRSGSSFPKNAVFSLALFLLVHLPASYQTRTGRTP